MIECRGMPGQAASRREKIKRDVIYFPDDSPVLASQVLNVMKKAYAYLEINRLYINGAEVSPLP